MSENTGKTIDPFPARLRSTLCETNEARDEGNKHVKSNTKRT